MEIIGCLLDTNIVSAHLKNNPRIQEKILQVRAEGQAVFISGITYYEQDLRKLSYPTPDVGAIRESPLPDIASVRKS